MLKSKLRKAARELYWRLPHNVRVAASQATYPFRDSFRKPLVTIVVPLFNEERFLGDALASVSAQSYRNLECIIVNDASTDGSRAIAEEFVQRDRRFRVVNHASNRGLAASRNTGLLQADGPLVTFLDSDDCLLPHTVWDRTVLLYRKASASLAGTFCYTQPVAEDWRLRHFESLRALGQRQKPRTVDFISSQGECPFNVHAPLLKTDVVRRFGGFREQMRDGAEDWELWLRILRHGYHFIATGTVGGIYRSKAGSMVRSAPGKHVEEGLRLVASAFAQLAPDQVVPGTPHVFEHGLPYYQRSLLEARRLIQFAALAYLGGDRASFESLLAQVEPGAEFYLEPHINIAGILRQAFVRFHCTSPGVIAKDHHPAIAELESATRDILARPRSASATKPGSGAEVVSLNPTRPPASARPALPDYLQLEENPADGMDREQIAAFRARHKGDRCFIVGNGPSLNRMDFSLLRDEITFGVNGIFYKTREVGFMPTYYVVEDSHVMRDNLDEIRAFRPTHRFFPSIFRHILRETDNVSYFLMNRGFYEPTSPNFRIPRFSADASERLYCGQSVTYINLQLAHYMGFQEVYLIGVDFDYVIPKSAIVDGLNITSTQDDPNHFHPDYFGKGKRWHDPQLEQVLKCYAFADLVFRWEGRHVFNATLGGKLEAFERRDFAELFPRRRKRRTAAVANTEAS